MIIETLAPGFLLAGSLLGGFAAIRLLLGGHREPAAVWLSLALTGLVVRMGKSSIHAFVPLGSEARNVGLLGMLFVGPAIWLFTQAVVSQRVYSRDQALHFLPALFFAAVLWWTPNAPGDAVSIAVYVSLLGHVSIYVLSSAAVAWRNRDRHNERMQLLWSVVIVVSFYAIAWWAVFLALPSAYVWMCVTHALISAALLLALIFRHNVVDWLLRPPRYRHLAQSDDDALNLLRDAEALLGEQQLYRDPDLTLRRLARRLGVSENALSRAVNQQGGQSFRSWLNALRIAEAKKQLDAGWLDRNSLTDLAAECGFNSQSSFIRSFRTVHNMSPGQYARQGQRQPR